MLRESDLRTGEQVRLACRTRSWTRPTAGLAPGFVQANLVVLPLDLAEDFRTFCQRNPQPCPLLDETRPGSPEPRRVAVGSDLRTDLPCYCIWQHGAVTDEPNQIGDRWRDDFVGFLLGCSFTFEAELTRHGIPMRHVELGCNVPMYRTNIDCEAAGVFRGPLVVSMRPLTRADAERAAAITAEFPGAHGPPVHIGDASGIGIRDLNRPEYGDPVPIEEDEVPVFWACGVTPQAALLEAAPPVAITHQPGHMFLTDLRDEDLRNPDKS